MSVAITTPAAEMPITLAEAKEHLRVDGSYEDSYITALIEAATNHVESHCGRSFTAQTLTLYLDAFADEIQLPRGPIAAISAITYYDANNALQTLATSVYDADLISDPATVSLAYGQAWPTLYSRKNAVRIAYTTAATVPDAVRMAIKLIIGQWFEMRSAVNDRIVYEIPNGIAALLANHRSYGF